MTNSCDELISQVLTQDPSANCALIKKAYDFAVKYHGDQLRESGEPYYQHPIEVAKIVATIKLDLYSVVAALLHDTIEDTTLTIDIIREEFGEKVALLVDGVTKLTKIQFQPDHIRQVENFRKLLIAISQDIRVLIIKLADRLHNMRTIQYLSDDKKHRIATETMEIYAPLAERIGIQEIKLELHDRAFKVLHPSMYDAIVAKLEAMVDNKEQLISKILEELCAALASLKIEFKIFGRQKTPFSIWMKMQYKNISFDQLADIMAFRIIVNNLLECYQVLGVIHSAFQMIPDQFQDFISTPKNNGYQSLHTVVIGPDQRRIEIQIRTQEMHEIAEWGLAAHWRYKQQLDPSGGEGKRYKWIKDLLVILEQSGDPTELWENTKMAMHYDQVFCFTPRGELIALPINATPVDFAYMLHSDVGNRCVGALINGKMATLKTILKNGDQVDIMTSITSHPSPSWESFVATGKARSEIRKFIRSQRRDEYLILGKNILEKEAKKFSIDFDKMNFKKIISRFGKNTVEEFFCSIGEGSIPRSQFVSLLFDVSSVENKTDFNKEIQNITSKNKANSGKTKNLLHEHCISGIEDGVAVYFAGCCYPVFGDPIIGIIHTAKGVMIHKVECTNGQKVSNPQNRVENLSWNKAYTDTPCLARLKAIVLKEVGSLAFITTAMAKAQIEVINLKVISMNQDCFEILIDVSVGNQTKLENVLTSIRVGKFVNSITRVKA